MARNEAGDADRRRNEARAAREAGESPSEAGVTTGASQQIRHLTHQDGRHPDQGSERDRAGGATDRSWTDREVTDYGPQHEQVLSALAQAEALSGGEGVYLEQVSAAAQLPQEETRALLHDLVSVHNLATQLEGADDPDLGPRFMTRPGL
jgi:hypothetical protein